jgi:ABC-2 type transport system ATP-binding protein
MQLKSPPPTAAVRIQSLQFCYGTHEVLRGVDLEIPRGKLFAFLGPNGSGKTTLFRVLSTLAPCQRGSVHILGYDLQHERMEIRRHIGVVFQMPSLDIELTVRENLHCQAALYGLSHADEQANERELLQLLGLWDRRRVRVKTLSGGQRRRVELAKGMIHRPDMLILDEPSTGLDPAARTDLWQHLEHLRDQFGVTVLLTTHLLEEAEKSDQLAILDEGKVVALGSPATLTASVGGDAITIDAHDAEQMVQDLRQRFSLNATLVDGRVRLEPSDSRRWMAALLDTFADDIQSITLSRPSLSDVYLAKTGRQFAYREEEAGDE